MTIGTRLFAALLTAGAIGKTLTAKELTTFAGIAMPDVPASSLNLSDKAAVRDANGKLVLNPRQATQYDALIFERTGAGYLVLAQDAVIPKPATKGRGTSEPLEATIARLRLMGIKVGDEPAKDAAVPPAKANGKQPQPSV